MATTESRIYKTASGLACKVEVKGDHRCVKVTDTGVWPLAHPKEARIKVSIGQLVYRRKKS